ncbi:platelet-activating factor acetylhydrolase, isoform II-domain-containing protein [Xylariomycetidae sp. FL2044]|nr:platelet-activating factor acetylhydrolase, isoform II-domain-containing protein [Xylariomycetidae sp. FL2044]
MKLDALIIAAVIESIRATSPILLPELSGPHQIGLSHHELTDHARLDPFAPHPSAPRHLMITLYYPTHSDTSLYPDSGLQLASQFSPATASYVDSLLSLESGIARRLKTRAWLNAPILSRSSRGSVLPDNNSIPSPESFLESTTEDHSQHQLPLLLFSPGFSFPRDLYTTLLSELASWGFAIAAVDHPYDAGFVEFPDGNIVRARDWTWPLGSHDRELDLSVRVADLRFVLERLEDNNRTSECDGSAEDQVDVTNGDRAVVATGEDIRQKPLTTQPKYRDCQDTSLLNTSRIIVLGHSFGGATAVNTLLSNWTLTPSTQVVGAIDLDGFLYGPAVRTGTEKPVLVLGFPEHQATDDPEPGIPAGWPSLHAWKRDFTIDGTVHESYSDLSVFADLGILKTEGIDVGRVKGERMLEIMSAYCRAFIERFLVGGGNEGLLDTDGVEAGFGEIKLRRRGE